MHEGASGFSSGKLLSPQLLSRLNRATGGLVRYLEASGGLRVLDVSADWVEDGAGKLWLTWVGPTTVATGAAGLDLGLTGLGGDRMAGRDSFLPRQARQVKRHKNAKPKRSGGCYHRCSEGVPAACKQRVCGLGSPTDHRSGSTDMKR